MLPKTACPDTLGAFNKNTQYRTAKPRTTSRFAIPRLLADPSRISREKHFKSNRRMARASTTPTTNSPSFRGLPIWLNVTHEGRLNRNSRRNEPGSTAKGTPTENIRHPRHAPRTKASGQLRPPRPPQTQTTRRHPPAGG